MSEVIGTSSEPITTSSVQPSSANPSTAEAQATANAGKKEISAATRISSLAELKEKAPKVYQKMMEGIAMNIVGDMREHQERLKKMMREGRDAAQG